MFHPHDPKARAYGLDDLSAYKGCKHLHVNESGQVVLWRANAKTTPGEAAYLIVPKVGGA